MCEIRAKDKDGGVVYGWYVPLDKRHFVVPPCGDPETELVRWFRTAHNTIQLWGAIEIDISTAAVKTGKLDKHGDDIYGSKGDMQGGDRVEHDDVRRRRLLVTWIEDRLTWGMGDGLLCDSQSIYLEIIKDQEGGPIGK